MSALLLDSIIAYPSKFVCAARRKPISAQAAKCLPIAVTQHPRIVSLPERIG